MEKDPMTSHLNLQQRLDHTEKLFRASLNRFHACRKRLPSFSKDLDPQVSLYADGLVDWIAGNIEWSAVNHRYKTFLNHLDRKNNIMRLQLNSPRRKLLRSVLIFLVVLIISVLGYLAL